MLEKLGWFYFLALIILTVSNVVSVMLETFKAILITLFKKKSEIGLCVIEMVSFMLMMGITGQGLVECF